ncbi:MAG TPA: EF-P lysine aminoacylase EpmA [Gammaproteobacteria bacterium]|nr:EF-P lysine aminoacylase EpmA [Gammaproteobacteria bacterium]
MIKSGIRGSGFGVREDVDRRRPADWQPTAPIPNLRKRAEILATIRTFFAERNVLEVDTPLLSAAASTDVHLNSVAAGAGYLHTSPEFAMKRLLSADSGDIYQICKVFRADEAGRFHNPEFTLLEWYRVGWGYRRLMDEVAALLAQVLATEAAPIRLGYRDAFMQELNLDPFTAHEDTLAAAVRSKGLDAPNLNRDECLDLLAGSCVYPALGCDRLCFIYDFPASQAALARVRSSESAGQPPVAERFEVFFNGIELGNGFTELTDAAEQRRRFAHDLARRRELARPEPPKDQRFLAALEVGLPECAGVAIGLDRVAMLVCDANHIGEVISFTAENA